MHCSNESYNFIGLSFRVIKWTQYQKLHLRINVVTANCEDSLRMDKDGKNTMGRIWDQRRVLKKSLKTRKR